LIPLVVDLLLYWLTQIFLHKFARKCWLVFGVIMMLTLLTQVLLGCLWYKFIMHYARSKMKVLVKVIVSFNLK
jgi:hypothetical protein